MYESDPDYPSYMSLEILEANKLEFDSDDEYWNYVEQKTIDRIQARDKKREEVFEETQIEIEAQRIAAAAERKETEGDIDKEWKIEYQKKIDQAWDNYNDKEESLRKYFESTYEEAKKAHKRPPMGITEYNQRLNELKRIRISKLTQVPAADICRTCLGEKFNTNAMRDCQACLGTGLKLSGSQIAAKRRTKKEAEQAEWTESQKMWKKREKLRLKRFTESGCFSEDGETKFC